MKTTLNKIFLLSLSTIMSTYSFAQNQLQWGTIDNQVSNAKTNIISILGHLAGVAISIGFLITLYNVITGKSDSKEKLGYFIAGLALYIIAVSIGWI